MTRPFSTMLAAGIALTGAGGLAQLATASDQPIGGTAEAVFRPEIIRVETWQLLQGSGEELYGQLCASCHGTTGSDRTPAASNLPAQAPPLTRLTAAGVPKEHWAYVIESSSDDVHHRAREGGGSMPCWQRIFREALRSDAAPLLISTKLVNYLDTVQE